MKKVKLACALSFCFFVCVFLVHAENPCEPGYWQSLQELPELVDATIDESPLDPLPPASASYKIKREGSLLLSKDSEEELIFLKGVGEYYEVSVSLFYHSDSFSGILRKVEENHLNLVRLFVNVGHLDNPNYL